LLETETVRDSAVRWVSWRCVYCL